MGLPLAAWISGDTALAQASETNPKIITNVLISLNAFFDIDFSKYVQDTFSDTEYYYLIGLDCQANLYKEELKIFSQIMKHASNGA